MSTFVLRYVLLLSQCTGSVLFSYTLERGGGLSKREGGYESNCMLVLIDVHCHCSYRLGQLH